MCKRPRQQCASVSDARADAGVLELQVWMQVCLQHSVDHTVSRAALASWKGACERATAVALGMASFIVLGRRGTLIKSPPLAPCCTAGVGHRQAGAADRGTAAAWREAPHSWGAFPRCRQRF